MKNQSAKRGEILKSSVWEKEDYFFLAKKVTLTDFLKNWGLKRLRMYSRNAFNVLDCGWGGGVVQETKKVTRGWGTMGLVETVNRVIPVGVRKLVS